MVTPVQVPQRRRRMTRSGVPSSAIYGALGSAHDPFSTTATVPSNVVSDGPTGWVELFTDSTVPAGEANGSDPRSSWNTPTPDC